MFGFYIWASKVRRISKQKKIDIEIIDKLVILDRLLFLANINC